MFRSGLPCKYWPDVSMLTFSECQESALDVYHSIASMHIWWVVTAPYAFEALTARAVTSTSLQTTSTHWRWSRLRGVPFIGLFKMCLTC